MSNDDQIKSLIIRSSGLGHINVFDLRVYLVENVMINNLLFLVCRLATLLDLFVHLVILLFFLDLCLSHLLCLLDLGLFLLNLGLSVLLVFLLQLVFNLINTDIYTYLV